MLSHAFLYALTTFYHSSGSDIHLFWLIAVDCTFLLIGNIPIYWSTGLPGCHLALLSSLRLEVQTPILLLSLSHSHNHSGSHTVFLG